MRILALVLGDIRLAEAYCARWAGQQGYLFLLDMLLHPGHGREPLYAEACHLLAAQGGLLITPTVSIASVRCSAP